MQSDRSVPRRDARHWEHRPRYGKRLLRQVGTDRFKSKVPDPTRPGKDKSETKVLRNWREAERWHRERLGKSERNELPENSRLTLDELAERRWTLLEGLVASGERAEGTLEADKLLYVKHLRPKLGRMRLEKMQAGHVSKLLSELRRSSLAPASITRIYAVLRSVLNLEPSGARVLDGLAKEERPSATVQTPSRCLTDEECPRLIARSLPGTKVLNAFYAFTGVRQAEGLGLTWGDLDLTSGTVNVQAQLSRKKRGQPARRVLLKAARRRLGAREREIDLHPDLVAVLKRHKADAFERGRAGASDFAFSTADGMPLYYRNVLRDLGTAADRAGLNDSEDVPRLSTHDLRHTAISRWIAAGLDEATVARMAGDTVEQIHKTYLHEFERARRKGRDPREAGRRDEYPARRWKRCRHEPLTMSAAQRDNLNRADISRSPSACSAARTRSTTGLRTTAAMRGFGKRRSKIGMSRSVPSA